MKRSDLKVGMQVAVVASRSAFHEKPDRAGCAEIIEIGVEYQVRSYGPGFRSVERTRNDGVRLRWIEDAPFSFSWKAPKTAGNGTAGSESILPARYLWMPWDNLLKLSESHAAAAKVRQKREAEQAEKRAAIKARLLSAGCSYPRVDNSQVTLTHEEVETLLSSSANVSPSDPPGGSNG